MGNNIAITGATGHLGRLVVEKLKGQNPVALVRSPEKASDLGIAVRAFDYDHPDASALQGVDTLLLISSNVPGEARIAQHRNVVEAAKAAGVKRIVYTSILRADSSPINLAIDHLATEKLIVQSGIPYTFLRNGWYHENYAGAIQGALASGAVIGAAGEGRISSAAREDYAEAAAVVLTGEGHENRIYELAGDSAWMLADLAALIAKSSGKEVGFRNLSESEYAEALAGFGLPSPTAASIASWDTGIANGALFDESRTLSGLIGRPTKPIEEYVRTVVSN